MVGRLTIGRQKRLLIIEKTLKDRLRLLRRRCRMIYRVGFIQLDHFNSLSRKLHLMIVMQKTTNNSLLKRRKKQRRLK